MIWRVAAVVAVWTGLWWLIIGALLAPVVPGGWTTIGVAAALAYSPLFVLIRAFAGAYPGVATRLLIFRPFWYVQLASLLLALSGAIGAVIGAPFGAAARTGRLTLTTTAMLFAMAAAAGYAGSRRLRVTHAVLRTEDLSPAFDGLRIVQLSDLHVGPHTSRRFLARVAAAVTRAAPDLIVFTGDQVDDYARDIELFARAFGALAAPLGQFAVAGNHDVYGGWPGVRRGLEAMGVTVLVNEAVEIARGADRLWIAGTGDPAGLASFPRGARAAAPDIDRTLARVPPGALHHRACAQSGAVAGACRSRHRAHAERTHPSRTGVNSIFALEPGVALSRARHGLAPARPQLPVHQPGHELLGAAAAPRRLAGDYRGDARPRRRWRPGTGCHDNDFSRLNRPARHRCVGLASEWPGQRPPRGFRSRTAA